MIIIRQLLNKAYLIMLMELLFTTPVFAINKCKMPDGKIVYQEKPCDLSSEKIHVEMELKSRQQLIQEKNKKDVEEKRKNMEHANIEFKKILEIFFEN